MIVFGWIALIAIALFGLGMLVLLITPFVASEIKTLEYKIKKAIEDKKFDADKRSEARRKRDEIARQKANELADKKLESKILKIDKQIDLYNKKLELSKELKETAVAEKAELQKELEPQSAIEVIEKRTRTTKTTHVDEVEDKPTDVE